MTYTKEGIAGGKDDIDYQGQSRVYKTELTLDEYEAGGIDWDPTLQAGLARVSIVDVSVTDDSAYLARYDHVERSIRLFDLADGTEPADAESIDVPVRIRAEGTG